MTKANKFGLSEVAFKKLMMLLCEFKEFERILVFGSRALGTYREGSDIDIAVFGSQISRETLRSFKIQYDELGLPYQVDIVHYESIDNPALKEHIDKVGVSFKDTI